MIYILLDSASYDVAVCPVDIQPRDRCTIIYENDERQEMAGILVNIRYYCALPPQSHPFILAND